MCTTHNMSISPKVTYVGTVQIMKCGLTLKLGKIVGHQTTNSIWDHSAQVNTSNCTKLPRYTVSFAIAVKVTGNTDIRLESFSE